MFILFILINRHALSYHCNSGQGVCFQAQENGSYQEFHFLVSLIPRHHSCSPEVSSLSSFFHTLLINSIHSPHRSAFPSRTSHSIPLLFSSTPHHQKHFTSLNHHLHSNTAILNAIILLSTQFTPNPSQILPFFASSHPQITPFILIQRTLKSISLTSKPPLPNPTDVIIPISFLKYHVKSTNSTREEE